MSSEETVGQQQPRERPEPSMPDDEIDAERERKRDGLGSICTEPGDRKTDDPRLLVIEAELACLDGKALGNPAKPTTENVGETFKERLDEHEEDLVPAWTRPWEVSDDE